MPIYTCTYCRRSAEIPISATNICEDVARVLGWRFPTDLSRKYCPKCTGQDANYWANYDRETALAKAQGGI